ncbi:ArgE/DapE family deacylase [Marinococcus luteus]|uniref:ArgE/DapE family deacylase n=1 Tax=Marinococcus luteus TaxID=1122204 RepID=UPI002ACCEC1A|nr:ArgE/DapE family deacylase [Marinococcus luteus]MDZ5784477.1 ArgE/DapE family deacylase [Marinococcus luteus]
MTETINASQKVLASVDRLWEEEIEFLQTIARFPSTIEYEGSLQLYLKNFFQNELEMDVETVDVDEKEISSLPGYSPSEWSYAGRPVVVAKAPRSSRNSEGSSLLFQGHVDVVSPEPKHKWSVDPWGAQRIGDRLYGRGVLDMKSGVAAMIYAYKAIRDAGYEPAADFSIKTVIEEEATGNGTLAAANAGHLADAVLIPEPFGQCPSTAQLGSLWLRIHIDTSSNLQSDQTGVGANAIEKAQSVIEALQSYREYVNRDDQKPPEFAHMKEPIDVEIGTMHSGDFASNIPVEATLEVRSAVYPGKDPSEGKQDLIDWILDKTKDDEWLREHPPAFESFGFHAEGMVMPEDDPLFAKLDEAHELVTGKQCGRQAIPVTTDARYYGLYYDTAVTCYGPSGAKMHEPDEWVDLESVKNVTKVYADFLIRWCGIYKKEGES